MAKNFYLHYDFRAPAIGPSADRVYAAALEQCAWGEKVGFGEVVISSHHGCDDDYGPSPIVAATAIAARTKSLHIVPVIALPLYDPIHVAEDVAVADLVSAGRVELVVGGGYRPSEFAMFGQEMSRRGRLLDEGITAIRRAWEGEPFEFRGSQILVRPRPHQRPGPQIAVAGFSEAAARRAARLGDAYMPMARTDPIDVYVAECRALGQTPSVRRLVNWMFLYVSEDPERAWHRLAPHLLHVSNSYAKWLSEAGATEVYKPASDVNALKGSGTFEVVTPDDAITLVENADNVIVDPLFGGCPPELAEESLELIATRVIPAFS